MATREAPTFDGLKAAYSKGWKALKLDPERVIAVDKAVATIRANLKRYQAVADKVGVPVLFIAATHMRESGFRFDGHLHNGDPLTARTFHVPKNRPRDGSPPFTWEESAIDAMRYHDLDKVENWPIERLLFELERYNGWGYYYHYEPSPYVWAGTNQSDEKGKYVRDGVWDPNAPEKQLGCAAVIWRLLQLDPWLLPGAAVAANAPAARPGQPAPKPPAKVTGFALGVAIAGAVAWFWQQISDWLAGLFHVGF